MVIRGRGLSKISKNCWRTLWVANLSIIGLTSCWGETPQVYPSLLSTHHQRIVIITTTINFCPQFFGIQIFRIVCILGPWFQSKSRSRSPPYLVFNLGLTAGQDETPQVYSSLLSTHHQRIVIITTIINFCLGLWLTLALTLNVMLERGDRSQLTALHIVLKRKNMFKND